MTNAHPLNSSAVELDTDALEAAVAEYERCRMNTGGGDLRIYSHLRAAIRAYLSRTQGEAEPVAWRPVVGFEQHYEVSELGDIRRAGTTRVLAKNKMGRGYIKADLWVDNKRTQTSVHRVVAAAFVPNPHDLPEVNHVDGDPTNNAASNLEWVYRAENQAHACSHLEHGVRPIVAILPDGSMDRYVSTEEAQRQGFSATNIWAALNGRKDEYRGRAWFYDDLPASPVAPAGYRVVPVEPTEAMLASIPASYSASFQAIWPKICGDIYRAMLAASPPPAVTVRAEERDGIYIASKTKHADRWRKLRADGVPFNSTWIDEAGEGESQNLQDLWRRCLSEASSAAAIIVYREPDDVLKGGWIELGAAASHGVPVFAVGIEQFTIARHRGIQHFATFDEALAAAIRALSTQQVTP